MDTISAADIVVVDPTQIFYWRHGWWLWVSWGILSYFMVASKRYMRFSWKVGHAIHVLFGYFITLVTLVWAFKALAYGGWNASQPSFHEVMGITLLSAILIVAFPGILVVMIGKFYKGTPAWSKTTEPQNKVAWFHKIAGYVIVLSGIATTTSGLYTY